MIMPAQDATFESCATNQRPIFGKVSPAHSSTFCDTCSVQACSAALGGTATTFVRPSGVTVTVMFVTLALPVTTFVFGDEGNRRMRQVSRNGRLDIHSLRSLFN